MYPKHKKIISILLITWMLFLTSCSKYYSCPLPTKQKGNLIQKLPKPKSYVKLININKN